MLSFVVIIIILVICFFSVTIDQTYGKPIITISNDEVALTETFAASLEKLLFKTYVEDIIELAQYNNRTHQGNQNGLQDQIEN